MFELHSILNSIRNLNNLNIFYYKQSKVMSLSRDKSLIRLPHCKLQLTSIRTDLWSTWYVESSFLFSQFNCTPYPLGILYNKQHSILRSKTRVLFCVMSSYIWIQLCPFTGHDRTTSSIRCVAYGFVLDLATPR